MAEKMQPEDSQTSRTTLELLYHISRELASDLDLQTVLQRVLKLSLEAVGGSSGSIIVLDDGGGQITSTIIHSGQVFTHTTRQLKEVLERGLAGWVVRQKQHVIIPDTSRDSRWIKRPDDAPEQTGSKSAMCSPLLAREEVVGVMTLVHPTPETFKEADAALMRAIADLAGITILNARLFEESRNRARAQAALAESAMAITASLGTEDMLKRILSQVQAALDVEAISLSLVDPGEERLSVRAAAGYTSEAVFGVRPALGEGVAGQVAQTGQAVVLTDLSTRNQVTSETEKYFGVRARSVVCVPIRAQDEVLGALQAFSPEAGAFTDEDRIVLAGIGSLAGSVIRYGQLFEKLETAHRRFRELFDDSIDLILITDPAGEVNQFNRQAREAMPQIFSDQGQQVSIFDLHRPDSPETPEGLLNRVTASPDIVTYESEIDTPQGSMPVQVFVRKIQLEGNISLQWILHNITERKRIEALQDDLISTIYHDLRAPLANVVYSLDMIRSMVPQADEELNPILAIAGRAVDRIQRLTASLLDIRALQAGQPLNNLSDAQPSALTDFACHAIHPLAAVKRQTITILEPEEDVTIRVDSDMIGRVLINLLENAVKYTPSGGRIEIGASQQNGIIRFWVEDNGPGIPENQRENIFTPYTRLQSGNMGFGLGLSFCRLAVEAHQGKIWVEDGAKSGARFVFTLPVQIPG